jgi:citrate lyase subunit beta/citryl-CoA lyase
VWTDVADTDGLERRAGRARAMGFFGKSVIHPRQIAPVHEVFTPSDDEVAAARRVIDHADQTGGATKLDGKLVDAAVVARARRVLEIAGRA